MSSNEMHINVSWCRRGLTAAGIAPATRRFDPHHGGHNIRRFVVHLPISKEVASRIMPVLAAAVEAAAVEAAAVAEAEGELVAARVAPSAASCWKHSVWNC